MRYNPVYSAFEKIQAMNSLKNYQRLLDEEIRKSDPNLEVIKYYRSRLSRCRQILGGRG
ncbi:hypothetical protein GTO91_13970 [Heliobacterium undosum]|uniref:Uncharacterized protein n=3 Tax=Heliomicrobium TaxID=2831443 RepID=B0TDL2_HELMI|nr:MULTISPECIES: hypothetical protein [Heliomicrobium]ABZ85537.1 hypothetical protein HM1_3030 [Heliomicrobium modesticaldum Ice1]MBM7867637.1 hypothetical protein [Heliomicrobium gestii]MZP30821.1 hypothetical protein [Heliomicrobium undosum]MZP44031.1 hypothetical protein [Heliomicrobium gestii]